MVCNQQLLRSGKLPQQQVDDAKMAWDELKEYDTASSEQNNIVEFLDATIKALEASEVDELATIADDGTLNSLAPSTRAQEQGRRSCRLQFCELSFLL